MVQFAGLKDERSRNSRVLPHFIDTSDVKMIISSHYPELMGTKKVWTKWKLDQNKKINKNKMIMTKDIIFSH